MLNILNESHILEGSAMKDLEYILGIIARTNAITFNEDELTRKVTGHVKSLHIAIECENDHLQSDY